MKIAFHTSKIDVRGSCVSLYDYAHYNEVLLGNNSIIIAPESTDHQNIAVRKFTKRFNVVYYKSIEDMDRLISDCDILYVIKYGKRDEIVSTTVKTVIHCVFDMTEPHGNVYAGVSDTLAKKFSKTAFVPHMIGLKPSRNGENMRKSLNIPDDAIVFGRHGGTDTFDLEFVKVAIMNVVTDSERLHFIFVNTPMFCNHPRIHHLGKITDLCEKNRFIASCDAMIHAQSLGETFGISIGEFSVNNKPIIAYNGPVWNDHYKNILGDNALWYVTEDECYHTMAKFDPYMYKNRDMNCYKQYSPVNVMKKFKEVFIDP